MVVVTLLAAILGIIIWLILRSSPQGKPQNFEASLTDKDEGKALQQFTGKKDLVTNERAKDTSPNATSTAIRASKSGSPSEISATDFILKNFPATIAFADVETTGLHSRDRIVTLAIALLNVADLTQDPVTLNFIHRIYNPGMKCHPDAERIHGHYDWTLRHQSFFVEEAAEVREFLHRAGMICCHNAEFDTNFIDREFLHAGLREISIPRYCTMKRFRQEYSGSASLANISAQMGMKRNAKTHGALEDVFLTMNVFLKINKISARITIPDGDSEKLGFQNLRSVPTLPVGPLPPRRGRPKSKASSFE